GVWLGYPLADPMMGLFITVAILPIVWESGKAVFGRLLDGVDPEVIDEITHAINHTQGVRDVTEVRLRWSGHRLHAEVTLAVSPRLSVAEGHAIAVEARHQLLHHLPYLSNVAIHIDPEDLSGEEHHRIKEHTHEGLAVHSHRLPAFCDDRLAELQSGRIAFGIAPVPGAMKSRRPVLCCCEVDRLR